MKWLLFFLTGLLCLAVLLPSARAERAGVIHLDQPLSPPNWALLQRELFRANALAVQEFYDRYFDDRGYLECVERWGGDDGPDDAIENCNDWPLLYLMGGDDKVRQLFNRAFEGHVRQYTAARTKEVPFARDGMYFREFPVTMDWVHNGEGLAVFNLFGLCDPHALKFQQRVRRFADFYLPGDRLAPNYDPQHKLIRSLFNGSRGPLMRPATPLDWAGDRIEIAGRFKPAHGERSYDEMLAHFQDYTEIVGDHPQNLLATSLAFNAFALTGESKYRSWLLEYVDAWSQRAADNNDILPSNIGLDGQIGGSAGGKWYGGVYGWGFTVVDPVTSKQVHRNTVRLSLPGFGNAFLLTGQPKYIDIWRRQLAALRAQAKMIDGKLQYPHMHGADGWYDYQPTPYRIGELEVWYWSQTDADQARVEQDPWVAYLTGGRSDFPEGMLRADLDRVRARVAAMRQDTTTPDTRLADDPHKFNPCSVGSLVQLSLGGLHPGKHGSPLHARLRYFDPARRRPGLPDDVAALVDRLTDNEAGVTLVNIHPTEYRQVIVQAGAYAEHRIEQVIVNHSTQTIDGTAATVELAPGAGGRLIVRMKRYAQPPRFAWPAALN